VFTKSELNARIDAFIEDWKNENFPDLQITFEGSEFILLDILDLRQTENCSTGEITNDKKTIISFVNQLNNRPDFDFVFEDNSIQSMLQQPKLLDLLKRLETELNKVKLGE